jgi:hypothetical protein
VDPLISIEALGKHPVSELFEFCQKARLGVKIVKDDWDKNLKVHVLIDGEVAGSAAKAALDKLKQTVGHYQTESVSKEDSEPFDRLDPDGTLKCQ